MMDLYLEELRRRKMLEMMQQQQFLSMLPHASSMFNSPMMLAQDGTSARTRQRLIEDAGFRQEDFLPTPIQPTQQPAQPLGVDPTRQVTQGEWEKMKAEQNRRATEKYLQYKQRRK